VIVDSAVYRQGERLPVDCRRHDYRALRLAAEGEHDFVWVGLHEPS
jgi:magnesium transporter